MKIRIQTSLVARALLGLFVPAAMAQTTTFWDGGTGGGGSSWATSANWLGDVIPTNASNSNVVINDRNGSGTISSLTISANRTIGSITFDNINSKLASTINVETNFSGTTDRTLTLHSGITLQNTDTSVVFRGNNGVLTIDLASDNVFATSTNSLLRFNDEVLVTGAGKVTKTGAGTLYFEGTSTYLGGTAIDSGTVQLGRSEAMGTGDVTLGSVGGGDAAIIGIYAGYTQPNNITVVAGSGGTLTLGYTSTSTSFTTSFTGDITLNDDLTLFGNSGAGNGFRLRGEIIGANNLTKTGNGRIRIEGGNASFAGTTTISEGILQIGNGGTAGTLGSGAVINDASLVINRSDSFTFDNDLSGIGSLIQEGTGTTSISNANTYTGDTIIAGGTLRIGRSGSLGDATSQVRLGSVGGGDASINSYLGGWSHDNNIEVVAGSGGTLTLGLSSTFASDTNYRGGITLNDDLAVESAAPDGNALRLTGQVSGGGALSIGGVGATQLESANTYGGGTSVITGTLLVTNFTGSATGTGSVTTEAGTVLGGTGTIAPTGSSAVAIGGSVEPGLEASNNGIGALRFTPVDGNVTFGPSASITFDLFSNGVNDQLIFASTGPSLIDFTGLSSGSLAVLFDPTYSPALNHSFDLIDWTSASGPAMQGLASSMLSLPTTGFDPSWEWDLTLFETQGVISIGTVIPEPSRVAFLTIAMGLSALRRRKSGRR